MKTTSPDILAQSIYTEATNGIESFKQRRISHGELVSSVLIAVGNATDTILGYPVNYPMINKGHITEEENGGDLVGAEANRALLEFERKEIKSSEVKERVLQVLLETVPFPKKED